MTGALIKYDAACRALAAAKSIDEAKQIRNVAEAMRAYAKQAKNRDLEIDAADIRIRAERRCGQLIRQQKQEIGLAKGTLRRGTKQDPRGNEPTLAEAGIDKHLADRARRLADYSDRAFETMLGRWRDRVRAETERVTTNLLREGERQQTQAARPPRELPVGCFRLLYADPPWRYEHVTTESRAIENQYPTMDLAAICALEIPAAEDAVLFLWATSPKLAEALEVVRSWGFDYRTCAVWDKESIGMGYYFRQQHELLLVAARGALPVPDPSARPPSVLRSRRGPHSEKPARVYELLEAMYPTFSERDRIELFARTARPGWSVWSNEPAVAS